MGYNKMIIDYFWHNKEEIRNELNELENYSKRLDLLLIKRHLISEDELVECYLKIIKGRVFSEEILKDNKNYFYNDISYDFISKFNILPLFQTGRKVTVLTNDPYNVKSINLIKKMYGVGVEVLLITSSEFNRFVKRYISKDILSGSIDDDISLTVSRQLENIVVKAITDLVSDIHLEPGAKNTLVRFRIDGVLQDYVVISNLIYTNLASKIKIMSEMDVSKTRIPQDGRFSYLYKKKEYDVRVSTMPTIFGEKIVLRILNSNNHLVNFDNLGFNEGTYNNILNLIRYNSGLVLVSGPTGSGKTTTLYGMLNEIDKKGKSIVTIEDPIEYKIDCVTQIPVYGNTQLDFKNAMKYILRQDPNVILVGEIRDDDTAKMAQRISLTGHLVLSTIHANSVQEVFYRMKELGSDYMMLIESLSMITNQRLIRILCPYCKKSHYTTLSENKILGLNESIVIYEKVGCEKCNNIGYKGRKALHEVLILDKNVKNNLLKGGDMENLIGTIGQNVICTIYQDACKEVKKGETTIDEIKRLGILNN